MEGISRYIYETTQRMVNANPKTEFHFLFDRKFDKKFIYAKNVIPVVLRPKARLPILWKFWFEWRVKNYMEKHDIDVFFSGESYLSIKSKVPTLMVTHDIAFEHFKDHLPNYQQKYLLKNSPLFHKRADHIVTVSKFTKNDIIKKYNMFPQKISVAGNASPLGFHKIPDTRKQEIRELFTDGKPFLIYLGSIHPRKNIVRLIQAFDLYKSNHKSDLKLLLIGRKAWNNSSFETAMQNVKCKNDIIHRSDIGDEVKQILASAEALVYISLFEGFGIPILEACSCEVPVICSENSAMSEVGGDAVMTVDPTNIKQISETIHTLMTNVLLQQKMKQNGLKRIAVYDWQKTADHIYFHLERLANH